MPSRKPWLLLPPLLLLACLYASSQLDNRALQEDELFTLLAIGGAWRVHRTPAEILASIAERSSEQAFGWPILMSLWVRAVGWSEPALRSLSLLAGALTLAFTWRLGRDFLSHVAGLLAVLMLATSGIFIGFMWFARSFTLITLCATVLLWCYCRIVLARRPARSIHAVGLLLASAGLLYLHYYASLIIVALALYHFLFAWRHRRRWIPPAVFLLAALAAMLQLPTFMRGLERSFHDENLKLSVLNAPEVLTTILRFLGNNTLPIPPVAGWLALFLLAAIVVAQLRRRGRQPQAVALLTFVLVANLSLALAANELVRVITGGRIRYIIPLWPVMALLTGQLVWRQRFRRYRPAEWLLVTMVVTGIHAVNHPTLKYSFNHASYRDRMHVIQRHLESTALPDDALLAGDFGGQFIWSLIGEYYLEPLPLTVYFLDAAHPQAWRAEARRHPRFWLLRTTGDSAATVAAAESLAADAVHCGSPQLKATAWLELLAWSEADCAAD